MYTCPNTGFPPGSKSERTLEVCSPVGPIFMFFLLLLLSLLLLSLLLLLLLILFAILLTFHIVPESMQAICGQYNITI